MGRLMIEFIILFLNISIFIILPFPLLGRELALPSLRLVGPSFSCVGVGQLCVVLIAVKNTVIQ